MSLSLRGVAGARRRGPTKQGGGRAGLDDCGTTALQDHWNTGGMMVDVELNRPSASPEKNVPENVLLSTSPNPLHSAAPSKLAKPQEVIAVLASPQNLSSAPKSELKTTPKGPMLSPSSAVVESAASQIVHRALKAMDTTVNPQSVRSAFKQETNFILDKSLDAINGVSKLMEGFAVTLDNVIGQAFVDWGTPSTRGPRESPSSSRPCGPTPPPAHRQEPTTRKSTEDAGWGDFDVVSESESPKKEKPARRQLGLENKHDPKPAPPIPAGHPPPAALPPAVPQPQPASERQGPPPRVPQTPPPDRKGLAESVDALVQEQVTEQLKALLREKARLAEENSRLQRERNGLQELLEFTMAQQAECIGDDEIFGNLYGPDDFGACSSSEAASSISSAGLLPVQSFIPLPPEAVLPGLVDGAASQS